jgi:hypothetical protein
MFSPPLGPEVNRFATFEEAWQKLFEELPPHERLEILSNPKGARAASHAKNAILASSNTEPSQPASGEVSKDQSPKMPEGFRPPDE